MLRVRIPPSDVRPARPRLPPPLRWDAPAPSVGVSIGRRAFLQAFAVAAAALLLPLTRARQASARVRGRFFTKREMATLTALCDRIIPPDHDPGAAALGAPRYIHRLLRAFDRPIPRIHAGGPFSGRNPFPDWDDGTPSRRRPRNRFKRFIPLSRIQELHWRAEIFGSASVPELAAFDGQFGAPLAGLRDVYRNGLARVDTIAAEVAGAPFAKLPIERQDEILAMLDDGAFAPDPRRAGRTFVDLLVQHTLEGCFAAPEYGGNRRGRGWTMLGLEGDSQPLGFSIFSRAVDGYVERPDHPVSTRNPDELSEPRPLTADGRLVQDTIAQLTAIFADGRC